MVHWEKEHAEQNVIPSAEWTGLWRTGGNYDAGNPENGLTGQISWVEYPAKYGFLPFIKKSVYGVIQALLI